MYQLVIGNKNYSSWSLRPWLLMKVAGIDFEEINVPIYTDAGKQQLLNYSDTAKVPVLIAEGISIWDSLAIAEYLAEQHAEKALWPRPRDGRAIARSVVSEMHSSFMAVRNKMPMNCKLSTTYKDIDPQLQKDINRICQIWGNCRKDYGQQGDFLFGRFSIADAFYAPVVMRFDTYGIPVGHIEREYMNSLLALEALQQWIGDAKLDPTHVEAYDMVPGN